MNRNLKGHAVSVVMCQLGEKLYNADYAALMTLGALSWRRKHGLTGGMCAMDIAIALKFQFVPLPSCCWNYPTCHPECHFPHCRLLHHVC